MLRSAGLACLFALVACGDPSGPPPVPSAVSALAAGSGFCAVTPEGPVYCWGYEAFGQTDGALGDCGLSTFPSRCVARPARLLVPEPLTSVTLGSVHACGLTASGKAYCWGQNQGGLLGTGSVQHERFAPQEVAGGHPFRQIAAGTSFTCALNTEGRAFCWGYPDLWGTIGQGEIGPFVLPAPVPVRTELRFSSLTAGSGHVCAITASGEAYCWGENFSGQLGISQAAPPCRTEQCSAVPAPVAGELRFRQIEAGFGHTCGIALDERAYCWGRNSWAAGNEGALGTGQSSSSSVPVAVAGGLRWARISTGGFHSCGVTTDGQAYCWGGNRRGELGDGSTVSRLSPVPVTGGHRFRDVAATLTATCGVTKSGDIYCWGSDDFKLLGAPPSDTCVLGEQTATTPCSTRPVRVEIQRAA